VSGSVPELERAIALNPRDADSWHRLAVAQFDAGRFDEVARCCRRVLEIDPRHAKALANLAAVLQRSGADDEAARHYREAIAADPTLAPPRFSLAVLLLAGGRRDEAIEQMRRAVALDSGRAEWHTLLGVVCSDAGHPLDAISSLETALRLSPDSARAHEQLGFNLLQIGDATGALARFRRALELATSEPEVASNSLFALNYISGQTPEAIYAEHAAWGQRLSHGRPEGPHANDSSPERRLRIGYVSADFREHSVASFFEPVLARHDHGHFEIFCYYNHGHADAMTQRLKSAADHWREVQALSDEAMADLVREDAIDILVDLGGHSAGNRLPAFGRKPAPVQVTYLGYPATTGLPAMDYRLTDAKVDPEGAGDRWYSERLVRLPDTMWCYRPHEGLPAAPPPPCFSTGHVTFGSLNHAAKISPQAIALWARLLKLLPEARLVITTIPTGTTNELLRKRFVDAGIAGGRLELHDRLPRQEFNDLVSRIDIALDPFPYGGTATTCDSLWLGVPVISLSGVTTASRSGASLLSTVGLEELVSRTAEEYLEIASQLARDPQRLAVIRAGLRERMRSSPLMDAERFTRNLESAYRGIWRRWCAGGAP
jgi:predicted O-linked N-acetylglucosamine transferase (SPINDLY family)